MGFPSFKKNTKTSTGNKTETKANFVTLASVWASDKSDSGYYAVANKSRNDYKAPGRLLFEDARTGQVYQINTISMLEPKKEVNGLVYNLTVNLNNPKSATLVGNASGSLDGDTDTNEVDDVEYEPAGSEDSDEE